jgi:hypothetical protein
MVKKILCLVTASALLLPQWVYAKAIKAEIKLLSIVAEKTVERKGDDIYFSIAAFRNDGAKKLVRFPTAPEHWLSRYLDKVKNVPLWSDVLEEGVAVNLDFELTEEELPPWIADESIGQIKLDLRNNNGAPVYQWSRSDDADKDKLKHTKESWSDREVFVVKGQGGFYKLSFELKMRNVESASRHVESAIMKR